MESPQLTEDEMAEIKKEVLEKLRPYLCEKVIAERHFDYLRAKRILSKEDTEDISSQVLNRRKTGKLLDYLAENPKGLDTLINSIRREGTQNFLVQRITDEVQKIKNEKLIQKAGNLLSSSEMAKDTSVTNNLSVFPSIESNSQKTEANILFHPEGEYSPLPSASPTLSPLDLKSLSLLEKASSLGNVETMPTTLSLPRPGEPGAPSLPPELEAEAEGACSNSSDPGFLPLRSRAP
ncbi:B-cell lymphoma/leukemia 10 isoform X1 [Hemiscyllium ocellatum]|uniref:B-cell lymphoma/leukemia 10 isoform X1 n=1 Tax=Hemiscyllium ocellatum TaxID=170820 RepID=UPI0029677A63|nr:B-cell lymphoma/leukemia 10 isoform X1 [Hemiscyllium ocellatum]